MKRPTNIKIEGGWEEGDKLGNSRENVFGDDTKR